MKKKAKIEVLSLIKAASTAVSHNDLLQELGNQFNRVTLYRALDRLVEEDEIHKIIDMNGVAKYALCHTCEHGHEHNHNHIHFSCVQCNAVSCLEHVVPQFSLPEEYEIREVNFTVSGLCPSCKKRN